MSKLFLGIDGGGTHLRCVVMTESGNIVAYSQAPSANPFSVGYETAISNLTSVIRECLANISQPITIQRSVFALAGMNTRKAVNTMQNVVSKSQLTSILNGNIHITSDTCAALWEGKKQLPAIALVAGTGSHCLGINIDGKVARASGMEYLLSDEGGAYYIGEEVIRAVARACDGSGRPTALKKSVFAKLNINTFSEFHDYIYSISSVKQGIANFAEFATQVAENDEVAHEIITNASMKLVSLIIAVVRKLELAQLSFQVIPIGGVFENSVFVRKTVMQELKLLYPMADIDFGTINAALGAAKLARDNISYDIWECYEDKEL